MQDKRCCSRESSGIARQYRSKSTSRFPPSPGRVSTCSERGREAHASRTAYFPPDQITDQPERFLAAEMIREKILLETEQEVPHSIAVFIDHWEEGKKLTRISATIYVERPGQRRSSSARKGPMLKHIGTMARQDIEADAR